MHLLKPFLVLLLASYPSLSNAWMVSLIADLGVRTGIRYCKYSDGKTYTFNSTDLCELSIQVSPPGLGRGTGYLVGEQQDGLTKVCVYDVLGEKKGIRLRATELCPVSRQF